METPTPGFSFGMRMGIVREQGELSKSAVAKSIKISPSTWNSYENDNTFPNTDTIALFCKLYNVNNYDWLINNEGDMYVKQQMQQ